MTESEHESDYPMLAVIREAPGLRVGGGVSYNLPEYQVDVSVRREAEDAWYAYACASDGDVDREVVVTRWHYGWRRWRAYEVDPATGGYGDLLSRQRHLEQALDWAVRCVVEEVTR